MKTEIAVLNLMKYNKKSDNSPMTRIQFIITSYKDGDKYIGVEPITCFYKGHEIFDKLKGIQMLKPYQAEFKEVKDYNNPLAVRNILKSVNGIAFE